MYQTFYTLTSIFNAEMIMMMMMILQMTKQRLEQVRTDPMVDHITVHPSFVFCVWIHMWSYEVSTNKMWAEMTYMTSDRSFRSQCLIHHTSLVPWSSEWRLAGPGVKTIWSGAIVSQWGTCSMNEKQTWDVISYWYFGVDCFCTKT